MLALSAITVSVGLAATTYSIIKNDTS